MDRGPLLKRKALSALVHKMWRNEAIEIVRDASSPGSYSRLFLVPKMSGECRTAIDLSSSTHSWKFPISRWRQDLTRFAIQAKGPDGKWTRKPLAYRKSNNLLITRPPEICVNLVFKHIHAPSSYTICRQFVPFIYCPL